MKYLLFFLVSYNLCVCQGKSLDEAYNNSYASKIAMELDCNNAKSFADKDIINDNMFLFLKSGEAPIVFYGDTIFENNYNVKFIEQGCIGSNCAKEYNQVIFDYLLKQNGKKWIKLIRKDTVGFKEWKKLL
jgi:hypothetical protein